MNSKRKPSRQQSSQYDKVFSCIAKYIDEEKDVAYLIGFDKGKETFVMYLLKEANKTIDQIADIADVSIEFVKNVKQKLSADK